MNQPAVSGTGVLSLALAVLAGCASIPRMPAGQTPEARTAAYLETIRNEPNELLLFLRDMPKGGDLHSHLSGAVYAESLIRWAAEDGLCVQTATMILALPPCGGGMRPASDALVDQTLHTRLVDAWSLRNWHPARNAGHEQFFDSFGKFGLAATRTGDMLAEVASRAAAQRVSYLELMVTPSEGRLAALGRQVGFDPDFGKLRAKLLRAGFRDSVSRARLTFDRAESRMRELLRCGAEGADPGCGVVVRYLYQVLRGLPPEQVFAHILAAFELTQLDARVAGFNLVMPEDYFVPMRDFSLHMAMIDYLHGVYPDVPVTLHAGELRQGLVPPEGLRFHIRESVEQGHARRIGHGVSVLHENDAVGLLRDMAARRILVEIALSSNAVILGVEGPEHPLRTYLRYGVPVALVTDDEGVSRSSMTNELRRAVEEQQLDYATLKRMVRNSLEYAFVEGPSFWADPVRFVPVSECVPANAGYNSTGCRELAAKSTRAQLQLTLEEALERFEASR